MSQGANVLRYSALLVGVFYGWSHQASITASAKVAKVNHEYEQKSKLIDKAKAEFTKKKLPAESKTSSGNIITDPDNPKFDLEAFLNMVAAGETPGKAA